MKNNDLMNKRKSHNRTERETCNGVYAISELRRELGRVLGGSYPQRIT